MGVLYGPKWSVTAMLFDLLLAVGYFVLTNISSVRLSSLYIYFRMKSAFDFMAGSMRTFVSK